MDELPLMAKYVQLGAVIVIGLATVVIAFLQAQTAKRKLKLDLFDKRLAIYETATAFIGEITRQGYVSPADPEQFLRDTREARWLFGHEIELYLNNRIYKPAIELQALQADNEQCGTKRTDLKDTIRGQHDILAQKLSRYLTLYD